MSKRPLAFCLFWCLCILIACDGQTGKTQTVEPETKTEQFNGISFVAPPKPIDSSWVSPVKDIHANWVAIIPYAYSLPNEDFVRYNEGIKWQWWGEQPEGVIATVNHAKKQGLKVMIKPQVWVHGSWPGDFDLSKDKAWQNWEADYTKYILTIATIADSLDADMLCIGTEFKHSAKKRESYWRGLIQEVRTVYDGPLTYASNWDCYQDVKFWDALDYIGIDAYFPLSNKPSPSKKELKKAWQGVKKEIQATASSYNKQVLFTEYGYRSIELTAWRNWETEDNYNLPVDLEAQSTSYEAIFETFWDEPWFAGGFLWKWYENHASSGGPANTDYTPQNKPAEKIISTIYQTH